MVQAKQALCLNSPYSSGHHKYQRGDHHCIYCGKEYKEIINERQTVLNARKAEASGNARAAARAAVQLQDAGGYPIDQYWIEADLRDIDHSVVTIHGIKEVGHAIRAATRLEEFTNGIKIHHLQKASKYARWETTTVNHGE